MSSPTPEALAEVMAHAINIAGELKSDAAWLWIDAYWPQRRDRDRPSRPLPPGADPDVVPGRRLDLGVGNDTARAAYTHSATLVVDAHRLAGVAVSRLIGRRPPVSRRRPARGDEFAPVVDAVVRRLRWLLGHDVTGFDDQLRQDAHAAAVTLIEAHAPLMRVMRDVDGVGELPASRRCRHCGDPARPGGRECAECNRRRLRNKAPRARRRHADAYEAQARRRARGEDHAASPLPQPPAPQQEAS